MLRKALISVSLFALTLGGTAYAQESGETDNEVSVPDLPGNIEVYTDGYIRLGLGAVELEDGGNALEPVVDMSVSAEVSRITQDGTIYGVGGEVRGQKEVGQRSFGGVAGDCPPGFVDCATVDVNGAQRIGAGHTGMFYGDGRNLTEDTGAELERAYVFLSNGYGDFIAGRDDGAASIFSLGAPVVTRAGRVSNSTVDFTGLAGVKTLNDASGFAEKVTYLSPRLGGDQIGLGVQLGISYSPDVEVCGVDYCVKPFSDDPLLPLTPQLSNMVEIGAAVDRKFGDVEVEATATYARADEDSELAEFDDFSSTGAGVEVKYKGFTLGASYLGSNNGWDGDNDYTAYDLGLAYERDRLGFMVGVGQASDNVAHVDALSAQAGMSYTKDNFSLGGGVQLMERGVPSVTLSGRGEQDEDAAVVFIEGAIDF